MPSLKCGILIRRVLHAMSLNSGGHLTHGAKPAQSGKWFNALHYEVDKENGLIDYKNVEKIALESKYSSSLTKA